MVIGVNARLLIADRMEGLARFTWETTKAMIESHPEDEFILFFDRQPDRQFTSYPNVKAVSIGPQARHPYLFYLWFEWMLPRHVKKYKVDVFYSADNFMSLSLDVPTLLAVHDLAFDKYPQFIGSSVRKYYHKYMPKFIKKAAHLITVSNYIKDEIKKDYGVPSSKIDVTYNALPQRIARDSKRPIKAGYFVAVSSIHPRKNQANLIKAYDLYRTQGNSETKLILIGRPSTVYPEFDAALKANRFRRDIEVLSNVDDASLDAYIEHAQALIYVSVYEGFGIPILEGFAAKVPVITSDVTSMPEVSGGAALLVDPLSPESIASALFEATNSRRRTELVRLGTDRLKSFDWNQSASIIYRRITELAIVT